MATSKEYCDYVTACLSKIGDVATKKMMGEYLLYYRGYLIGEICDNRLLMKQTTTSRRLLKDCSLEYPYYGSKTLMFAVKDFENTELMRELLTGIIEEFQDKSKQ